MAHGCFSESEIIIVISMGLVSSYTYEQCTLRRESLKKS